MKPITFFFSLMFLTVIPVLAFADTKWTISGPISVEVNLDKYKCSDTHPLHVTIKNNSFSDVNYTKFVFEARKPERSTNIVNQYNRNPYGSTDYIIKSFTEKELCFAAPKLDVDLRPEEVVWDVKIEYIR